MPPDFHALVACFGGAVVASVLSLYQCARRAKVPAVLFVGFVDQDPGSTSETMKLSGVDVAWVKPLCLCVDLAPCGGALKKRIARRRNPC
jgi:hypothetical protein